jgi:Skp family chaperone for outer membrane proteins
MLQFAVDSSLSMARSSVYGRAGEVAMKNFVRWILTLVVVCVAVPAAAGKIGFLDTERAVKTVKEGQRQMQVLDAWSNQRTDQVESLRDRVNEIAEQINAQRTIASDEVLTNLENEFLQAKRSFEDAGRALQRDFEAKQEELFAQVATRVRDSAGEYAKANGFDAVLMFETVPLVYVNESVIITDAVIQLYNERYPVN